VVTARDGWPLWVSPVRPGREHDTNCARAHPGPVRRARRVDRSRACGAGRSGLRGRGRSRDLPDQEAQHAEPPSCATRPASVVALSVEQHTINMLHSATRALAERGNSLLKTTFKALRRVSLCPWRIGAITAAALVLLHAEHGHTT
jgi:hypothetical protein